jgi:hypothetical protein
MNPNFKRLRFSNLDTLSDVLDKCLRFSLIKTESVSIFNNQASLGSFPILCCIYFPIKIVLIKN